MNIKKGDTVKILAGKDGGKTGKVINVDVKNGKISVEGLNMFKKHVRPKKQGEKGEVVQLSRPMNVSNAILVCSSCGKPTRPGYRVEGKKKIRFCKKCQANT
jgi:large subunit ribosomal protein L24